MLSIQKTSATLFATAMLGFGIAGPAAAQNNSQQNGLVNVSVGDVTISDINIGVAASVAATVCGVNVGPVVLLAQQVDATSVTRTVCTTDAGPVRITQA